MEEQKYFIPKIEDIKIGYECEADISFYTNAHKPTWNKNIFKGVGQDVIKYHSWGMYRTPYLTKEQIESEDWIFTQQIGNTLFFKKKDFELTFNTNRIEINNFGEYDLGYWGNCKDINTFRYICKLLEI